MNWTFQLVKTTIIAGSYWNISLSRRDNIPHLNSPLKWILHIFTAAPEKQLFKNVLKKQLSSEAAIKMYFWKSLLWTCGQIFWKMRWSASSRKFACNSFLLLTTGAEELYFITWKAVFVFWKAGENFRKTSEIIRHITSSSFL